MKKFSYKFYRTTSSALQAMFLAIREANESIYLEVYSLIDDPTGSPFLDLLGKKAQEGLDVKVIVDAIGSFELTRGAINKLRENGVDVLVYNSLRPKWSLGMWFKNIWYRNHRKVLVVDRNVVFLGGVNMAEMYKTWDDMHVRFTGKIAAPILYSFARAYVRGGGDRAKVEHLLLKQFNKKFKKEWQEFKKRCQFLLHSPLEFKHSHAHKVFLNSLDKAKSNFNILTPYFVADKKFIKLVKEAKQRGVKMDLFLPIKPDKKYLEWVLGFYSKVAHQHGMNVYLSEKMHHGKALTVDSSFGFVGSVNFTHRSFFINDEAGVEIRDTQMIFDLESVFADLRQSSILLTEKNYLHTGILGKLKDWLGRFFALLI